MLRDTTGDDSRRRGRARIRIAAAGAHVDATRGAALRRTLLLTFRAVVVRQTAANVGRGWGRRAGVGEARARTHVRAALRRTLIGARLLALGPVIIVREAALHAALIVAVVRHLVLQHVLALVVAHLHLLPARIDAEELIAPVLGATEASGTGPGCTRGEGPDPYARHADTVGSAGLQIAPAHAELPSVALGVDRGHGDALRIRVDPGRPQGLLDGSAAGARRERHNGEDERRASKDPQHGSPPYV